jgi:hypothetical protein
LVELSDKEQIKLMECHQNGGNGEKDDVEDLYNALGTKMMTAK